MKHKLIPTILLLIPLVVGTLAPSLSYAQAVAWEAPKVSVGPNDGFRFILKRLTEKVLLTAWGLFPDKKEALYEKLFDYRLGELVEVATEKDIANIETASVRYSSTAGQLAEYILAKKMDNRKQGAKERMEKHIPILKEAQKNFDGLSSEWRFMEDDINSLKIYINNLSR